MTASPGARKSRPRSAERLEPAPPPVQPAVRRAKLEDLGRLSQALGDAFIDDPGFRHLLPDSPGRRERLHRFYTAVLREAAFPRGSIWTTEDLAGGAVWAPPGTWRVPVGPSMRMTPAMVRVFGRRVPVALRSHLRMERLHPEDPPHWYLAIMGVEPASQGRGVGTRLLAPGLEAIDASGDAAYLESSTPRSRALYARHGFEVVGEFNLPGGGPPLWRMWRAPRA